MIDTASFPKPSIQHAGALPRRRVDLVVIHCSGTPSGKPLEQGKPGSPGYLSAPKVINAWHAARGFKRAAEAARAFSPELPAIGYHYVIDLDGTVWAGRNPDEVGAHVSAFNATSVGVCLIGGAEVEARYTPAQWKSLREVVAMLCVDYGVPLASVFRPTHITKPTGVCGHRDLSPDADGSGRAEPSEWLKSCPGFDVDDWIERGMEPSTAHVYEPATGLRDKLAGIANLGEVRR